MFPYNQALKGKPHSHESWLCKSTQNQFFGFGYLDVNQNCLTLRLGNLSNSKLTFLIFLLCGLTTMKQTCSQFELNFTFEFYTQLLGLNNWLQTHFIGCPCPGESHSDDLASSLPVWSHWHPRSTCKVSRNIPILLWTLGVAGLMCITLCWIAFIFNYKYIEDKHIYT